jgi:hypothetical protein
MSVALDRCPADVLRWLLVQLGVGIDPGAYDPRYAGGWPVYADAEPDKPDQCVTVLDILAQEDGRSMTDGEMFRHFGLQMRVRSVDCQSGLIQAEKIRWALAEEVRRTVVTVGSEQYLVHAVSPSSVLRLGRDFPNTGRHLHTLNARAALGAP